MKKIGFVLLTVSLLLISGLAQALTAEEEANLDIAELDGITESFSNSSRVSKIQAYFDDYVENSGEVDLRTRWILSKPENKAMFSRIVGYASIWPRSGIRKVAENMMNEEAAREPGGFCDVLTAVLAVAQQLAPILIMIDPAIGGIVNVVVAILPALMMIFCA